MSYGFAVLHINDADYKLEAFDLHNLVHAVGVTPVALHIAREVGWDIWRYRPNEEPQSVQGLKECGCP